MKRNRVLPFFLTAFALLMTPDSSSWADDLEDGISKPTDDAIAAADTIGQPDKNIKYIIVKAKSKASGGKSKDGAGSAGSGDGNMNSVVVGPGSNIKGDVIIIDQSKGEKTQVVE